MRTLIAGARQKGRSWDDIGRRLDMTADEAECAYRKLSDLDEREQRTGWRHIVVAALDGLAAALDAVSEALQPGVARAGTLPSSLISRIRTPDGHPGRRFARSSPNPPTAPGSKSSWRDECEVASVCHHSQMADESDRGFPAGRTGAPPGQPRAGLPSRAGGTGDRRLGGPRPDHCRGARASRDGPRAGEPVSRAVRACGRCWPPRPAAWCSAAACDVTDEHAVHALWTGCSPTSGGSTCW